MVSSFKSILPSDNNEKTTIVFDWRDRAIAKWLEVRLWWKRCTCCLRRRPEEGCCYGATLRLNRSEWTLQQLVKTRRFQWINVRRIKLYMVTADIVDMHKVYSTLWDGCANTSICVEWHGSVGLKRHYYATKRYTHSQHNSIIVISAVIGVDSAEIFVITPSFLLMRGVEDTHSCALIDFYFTSYVKISTYRAATCNHISLYKNPEHYIFYIMAPHLVKYATREEIPWW